MKKHNKITATSPRDPCALCQLSSIDMGDKLKKEVLKRYSDVICLFLGVKQFIPF
jgi:hypothetical protein